MKPERQDRVVIMARGQGMRMGGPKGLLRLTASGPVFVRLIADLYLSLGFKIDVVARRGEAEAHRSHLPAGEDLTVLAAADGGDTAWTLLTAYRTWAAAGRGCSHVWAHPVDLPLVRPETVAQLRKLSRRNPHRVLRPGWEKIPGHPVVMPVAVLADLGEQAAWQQGPLREFLEHAQAAGLGYGIKVVATSDPGVVRDFDRPEDLDPDRPAINGSEIP